MELLQTRWTRRIDSLDDVILGIPQLTTCPPCSHVIRHIQKTSLDVIEITGSQMVLCMKLISFAWSVYDGQQPISALDATQRKSRIESVPGLIPFLGYA